MLSNWIASALYNIIVFWCDPNPNDLYQGRVIQFVLFAWDYFRPLKWTEYSFFFSTYGNSLYANISNQGTYTAYRKQIRCWYSTSEWYYFRIVFCKGNTRAIAIAKLSPSTRIYVAAAQLRVCGVIKTVLKLHTSYTTCGEKIKQKQTLA